MEHIGKIRINGYDFEIKCTKAVKYQITIDEYLAAKEICDKYERLSGLREKNNTLIVDFPFSTRAKNVLQWVKRDFKLETLSDLKDIIEKEGKEKFMKRRNMGKKTFDEIYSSVH